MPSADLQQLWTDFLAAWPASKVREMTLDQYTNLDKSDAFVYWLEKRTEALGSIWGGSAFKWGVYRRNDKAKREDGRGIKWTDDHAWYTRYGETAEQAFLTIRERLCEVIEAARQGELERIENIEVCWPIVKWKVAFLYQDRDNPRIFPLYHEDRLFQRYRVIAPSARASESRRAVMYPTLLDHYRPVGDVFDICRTLIEQEGAAGSSGGRYWAVPLSVALSSDQALALCSQREVHPQDVPSVLGALLTAAEVASGDHLALLVGDEVRAVGEVEVAEAEGFVWSQRSVVIVHDMVVPARVVELEAETRDAIWGQVPVGAGPDAQYWKIAPGEKGHLWEKWRSGGYIAVGWDAFGDISKDTRESFGKKVELHKDKVGYGKRGVWQVWRFRDIPVGARVVANRGISEVLAFGTVIGGYEHHPEAGEYCHWHRVRWDDLRPRTVLRRGWVSTLIALSPTEFDALLAAPVKERTAQGEDGEQAEVVVERVKAGPIREPQTLILFGPPGTGKTWSTTARALQLLLGEEAVAAMSDETRALQFRELQRQGRIEFVTFHQSYGYEEFVEGIRPVLNTDAGGDVRYEVHDGAFKRIALRAASEGLRLAPDPDAFGTLWQQLLDDLAKEGERVVQASPGKSYLLRRTSQGNVETLLCDLDAEGTITPREQRQVASRENVKLVWAHRAALGVEPSAFTYEKTKKVFATERGGDGGHHYTAIRLVYAEILALSRSGRTRGPSTPTTEVVQEALDRKQAGTVDFQFDERTRPYVLVIDEINRGNISKILGELITLLEPDKRLGAPNELKLPLAYSPHRRFAVPPNLHIIGTMNTADRSIALMDVALRRRFRFEEMLPDAAILRDRLLAKNVDGALVDLAVDLFDTLNARIRFLYDRDHQIGHAYFLKVRNLGDLRDVFADRVIPLLQEYFYGAWDKVCLVLGCPYNEDGRPQRKGPCVSGDAYVAPMVVARRQDEESVLGFDHEELEPGLDIEVAPSFRSAPVGRERPSDKLIEAFLGVLNLDAAAWEARRQALQPAAGA